MFAITHLFKIDSLLCKINLLKWIPNTTFKDTPLVALLFPFETKHVSLNVFVSIVTRGERLSDEKKCTQIELKDGSHKCYQDKCNIYAGIGMKICDNKPHVVRRG